MNITGDVNKDIIAIADHYGYASQVNILTEECAEVIQAISKQRRVTESNYDDELLEKASNDLIEEMADVEIMLEQIKHLLGVNPRYFDLIKAKKVERQMLRIKNEKRG